MTLPKKKKGYRSITVNEIKFNWKFDGRIVIRPTLYKNNILMVDFGWSDVWLFPKDKESEPPEYEPKKVTPGFVRNAIIEAIKLGWKNVNQNDVFILRYREGTFDK